jgi:hypothetical protein
VSSAKLKSAMLKMNSACIIRCAAIDPHLFNDGGRIGGNEFRVRLDESLLAAALVICFAAQCGKALAYACNNNYCVNSSSGSNLTFESGLGFPGDSRRASLADANRRFPFCHICR